MSIWDDIAGGIGGVAGGTAGLFTGGPVGAVAGYKGGRSLGEKAVGLFGKTDAQKDAERQQQEALQQIEQEYSAYQPFSDSAHQASLQQQISLFAPINDMIEQMYGPQFRIDFSAFDKSPLSTAHDLGQMSDPQLRSQQHQQDFRASEPALEQKLLKNARKGP